MKRRSFRKKSYKDWYEEGYNNFCEVDLEQVEEFYNEGNPFSIDYVEDDESTYEIVSDYVNMDGIIPEMEEDCCDDLCDSCIENCMKNNEDVDDCREECWEDYEDDIYDCVEECKVEYLNGATRKFRELIEEKANKQARLKRSFRKRAKEKYLWVRYGEFGTYEEFYSISDAANVLNELGIKELRREPAGGIITDRGYLLPIYWGDEDANWLEDFSDEDIKEMNDDLKNWREF